MKGSNLAFIAWMGAIGIWGAAKLAQSAGIRINHTPSLPVGIWRVTPLHGPLPRDRTVSFCAPETEFFRDALRRNAIGHGRCPGGWEAMLKPVAAVAGDHVEVKRSGLDINGAPVPGTMRLPSQTEAIPLGAYTVGEGEIWVIANGHPRSFDSRYFGPIPLAQIEGVAEPLLTWPSASPGDEPAPSH